ncbi:MAG: hypothetical protein HUJ58_00640 [Erysipelotrichaceae bacterium]|nr:hypothetical protein [Erysipelotrichaceae bacterium]
MKRLILLLSVFLLIAGSYIPVSADEEEMRTYEIDLYGNKESYYEYVTETDTVIIKVTDGSLPKGNSRIIGAEEFAPGSYSRTISYQRKPVKSKAALKLEWKVRFTVSATAKPRITSVSDFISSDYFATTGGPTITNPIASVSKAANAYAYGRDVIYKPDGKSTVVHMNFNLYHDDSASVHIQDIVASN